MEVGHNKRFEKAEKAIDADEEDMVMCLLASESKKECKKKKVSFTKDVKQPFEAGMMCTIGGDIFFIHKGYLDQRLRCIMSYHQQQYWLI